MNIRRVLRAIWLGLPDALAGAALFVGATVAIIAAGGLFVLAGHYPAVALPVIALGLLVAIAYDNGKDRL